MNGIARVLELGLAAAAAVVVMRVANSSRLLQTVGNNKTFLVVWRLQEGGGNAH